MLTYHRFGNVPHDPFCVAPCDFQRQMQWLADHRLAVSLKDLEAFLAGEKTLPDGRRKRLGFLIAEYKESQYPKERRARRKAAEKDTGG